MKGNQDCTQRHILLCHLGQTLLGNMRLQLVQAGVLVGGAWLGRQIRAIYFIVPTIRDNFMAKNLHATKRDTKSHNLHPQEKQWPPPHSFHMGDPPWVKMQK